MRNSEHNLQSLMVRWFDLVYSEYRLNLFAVPNGQNKSKIQAAKFKREGRRSGVPDMFLPYASSSFHGLFLEFKKPKGKISDNQAQWIKGLKANNFRCEVVYSCDEATSIVLDYLQLNATDQ